MLLLLPKYETLRIFYWALQSQLQQSNFGNNIHSKNVFILFTNYFNPLSPECATFLAELCNPVTHQAIELESCSNLFRFRKSRSQNKIKKISFWVWAFLGGNVTSRGVFGLFWPSLPGPRRHLNGSFCGLKV